jgi:hypothetical protein
MDGNGGSPDRVSLEGLEDFPEEFADSVEQCI